ncbi:MAG TPA: DUF397 domain-containing protein [Nocardia sp.]|uniref:DUF397 domain-containing protein n=1 Tax=Nocardia TaxID=1817 RepID=UPI0024564485|nr:MULTISPECIES: DUF397 domain-containing protein [Nocardia]HLS77197.1 DUF397 domain-containing protein [Nocardia sp.]
MATNAGGRPRRSGWFTSSRSNNGNQCVEVMFDVAAVWIRDSKFRSGSEGAPAAPAAQPVIALSPAEWDELIACLREGRTVPGLVTETQAGAVELRRGRTVLSFTRPEWDAFLAGVADGEFDRVPQPG